VFGLWAGTAVNDTSQVVAVGAAYSSAALNVATVVKLIRNTLMAPIIVFIGLAYSRAGQHRLTHQAAEATHLTFGKLVPWFVLGFCFWRSSARWCGRRRVAAKCRSSGHFAGICGGIKVC